MEADETTEDIILDEEETKIIKARELELKQAVSVGKQTAEIKNKKLMGILRKMLTELEISVANKDKQIKESEHNTKRMIHDLKAPLSIIPTFCEILKEDLKNNADALDMLNRIQCNGTQAIETINNYLSFNEFTNEFENCNPELVIQNITKEFRDKRKKEKKRGVSIFHKENNSINHIVALPYIHFSTIVHNLMSNADKFTKKGHIDISLRHSTGKKYEFTLKVQDTGVGISKEEKHKIFDEGYYNKTGNKNGSGFGLHAVKKAAEALGGDVRVSSKENHSGTQFIVRFSSKTFQQEKQQSAE